MIYYNKLKTYLKKKFTKLRKVQFEEHNANGNDYTVAIHCGEGKEFFYIIEMWLPYFIKSNIAFCIILRNNFLYKKCKKRISNIPIYFVQEENDLNKLLRTLKNLKTVFYVSNHGSNLHFLLWASYQHVLLGHGESDKSGSAHAIYKIYNEYWLTGQAQKDRLQNAGINMSGVKLVEIGFPQIYEQLEFVDKNPWNENCKDYNILYAPTWEGVLKEQHYSSLYLAQFFLPLLSEFNIKKIRIKLHPLTGTVNPDYNDYYKKVKHILKNSAIEIYSYSKKIKLEEALISNNVFICDCSAALIYCLAMDSPLFVYINKNGESIQHNSNVTVETFAYTFSSPDEFKEIFKKFVELGDYLINQRKTAREYFLNTKAIKDEVFLKLLQALQ